MAVDRSAYPYQAFETVAGKIVEFDEEIYPGGGFINASATREEAIAKCNKYAIEHPDEEITLFYWSGNHAQHKNRIETWYPSE